MEDLTLQMFLLRELPCSLLDSADHMSLAAVDMPDGKSTLADHVDPSHFEHIRLKPETSFQIDVIQEIVARYYHELKYDIETVRDFDGGFAMVVRLSDQHLSIMCVIGEEGNLNITVS